MNRRRLSLILTLALASATALTLNVGFAFKTIEGNLYLFLSTFAIGILISLASSAVFGEIYSARQTSESAMQASRLSNEELLSTLVKIAKSGRETRDEAYLHLMYDIRKIEKEGMGLLVAAGMPPRRRGFLALRSGLFDLGIWDDDDARRFDEALRVRNALVHGDIKDVSEEKVRHAAKIIGDLLEKLRATDIGARA